MKTRLVLLVLVLASSLSFGQRKLADKFFKKYAYIKAAELYEEVLSKGDTTAHVLTHLGDCFYNNSNSEMAADFYKIAIEKFENKISAEYIYKYCQTLRSLGDYEGANECLRKFKEIRANDSRALHFLEDLMAYDSLSSTTGVYVNIKNLDLNSEYSDFGSFVKNGRFYFASTRNTDRKIYDWNQQPYLDIYESGISIAKDSFNLTDLNLIGSEEVNTEFHESSVAISSDGNTMYFTRDNVNKRNKLKYDEKGTSHLKIYKAILVNGSWGNVEELPSPINDKKFSTGHPALSPDGKTLYFVSDRDGGLGQTDIYKVDINEDGSYGAVTNLGDKINTEGREMFPFVASDSSMYFSSDGHLNIGLLDIFKSNFLKDENADPINLGAPYNSPDDDFAYYVDAGKQYGFFSSNRQGGKGNDDIYGFSEYECKQTVSGVVRDKKTGDPLAVATVQKIDRFGKVLEEFNTPMDGSYSFEVECDESYTILAMKPDYKSDMKEVQTTDENGQENKVDLDLEPLIQDDQIVINPIFFDFDKWNIRTDAKYELENIVDVMRQHPNMVIKIESHTDSRGSDRYNMKLSDRRAKSTRDYLLSRGITANRIESAIGYGESQLLNECEDGVRCSEDAHQLNRRSYFYIVRQ